MMRSAPCPFNEGPEIPISFRLPQSPPSPLHQRINQPCKMEEVQQCLFWWDQVDRQIRSDDLGVIVSGRDEQVIHGSGNLTQLPRTNPSRGQQNRQRDVHVIPSPRLISPSGPAIKTSITYTVVKLKTARI